MRRLVLLTLVTLAAFPLSAHDHWHGPRRVMVVEAPRCAPSRGWEDSRWDNRYERRYERRHDHGGWVHRDCDEDRVILRPMPRPLYPPFEGHVVIRLH
jgi:hypothetical protein